MSFRQDRLPFILFLGGLTAASPLSIDMALPSFPQIEAALSASPETVAYTISIFLLGFALGPLALGPLADRFGRRPVLLGGFLLFTLAGFGCAASGASWQLLICRLLQGIGAGAGGILPFVIVRDLFVGATARARLSAITTVLGVGPIIAPILGAAMLKVSDWRGIYGVLGLFGAVLFLAGWAFFAESLAPERRRPISVGHIASAYGAVFSHFDFIRSTVINAAGFGVMFAYIAGSPSVMMTNLGASDQLYSLLFACAAAAFIVGSIANGRLTARTGNSHLSLLIASLALVVGGAGVLILSLISTLGLVSFAVCAALALFGVGLMAPSTIHDALHPMGKLSGVASAAFRFVQMVVAAVASALVGLLYDGHTANALGIVMLGVAVISLIATLVPPREEGDVAH